jgi:hypothetical protein
MMQVAKPDTILVQRWQYSVWRSRGRAGFSFDDWVFLGLLGYACPVLLEIDGALAGFVSVPLVENLHSTGHFAHKNGSVVSAGEIAVSALMAGGNGRAFRKVAGRKGGLQTSAFAP